MGLGYGFGYDLGSCPGVPQSYGTTGNYGYAGGVNNYSTQPNNNYEGSYTANGNIAPYKRAESTDSSGAQFATFMGATAAIGGAMVLASKKHKKADKNQENYNQNERYKVNPDNDYHSYNEDTHEFDHFDKGHFNSDENIINNVHESETSESVDDFLKRMDEKSSTESLSENVENAEGKLQGQGEEIVGWNAKGERIPLVDVDADKVQGETVEQAVQDKAAIANKETAAAQKIELKPLSEIINPNSQITIPEHIAEKPVVQNTVTPNLPAIKAKTDIVPTGTKDLVAPNTKSVVARIAETAEDIPYIEAEEVPGTGGWVLPKSRRIEQKPETGLTRTRVQRPRLTNIVDAEYEEIPLNRLEVKTPNLPVRTKGNLKPITEYLEKAPKEYKIPVKAPKLLEVLSDVAKHFKK